MHIQEIKEMISKRRSTSTILQIHTKPPIKMFGEGFYGHETINTDEVLKLLNNKD